ncbi:MAG: hypothetical protein P8Z30_05550 [Acidobacteriota bacterium]
MLCARSLDDFDRKVNTILEREFKTVVEIGLLTEEALRPVVARMRSSLREAYPAMSAAEVDIHLQRLQDQCREIAYRIFDLSYTKYWN